MKGESFMVLSRIIIKKIIKTLTDVDKPSCSVIIIHLKYRGTVYDIKGALDILQ